MLLAAFPEAAHPMLEPMVCVSKEQADELAKRVIAVASFYDLGKYTDSKTVAWVMLGATAATVYGPKVMLMLELRKQLRSVNVGPVTAAEINTPSNVSPIRPPPKTPGGLEIG